MTGSASEILEDDGGASGTFALARAITSFNGGFFSFSFLIGGMLSLVFDWYLSCIILSFRVYLQDPISILYRTKSKTNRNFTIFSKNISRKLQLAIAICDKIIFFYKASYSDTVLFLLERDNNEL